MLYSCLWKEGLKAQHGVFTLQTAVEGGPAPLAQANDDRVEDAESYTASFYSKIQT